MGMIPSPNSHQEVFRRGQELFVYTLRNPQILPHDSRCTATTTDSDRIYVSRISEVTMTGEHEDSAHG